MADENDFLTGWAAGPSENATDDAGDAGGGEVDNGTEVVENVDDAPAGDGNDDTGSTPEAEHREGHQVPYAAMKTEREGRKAERERADRAEARAKELEAALGRVERGETRSQPATAPVPAAEAPQFWDDPQAFIQQSIQAAVGNVQREQFARLERQQAKEHADYGEVAAFAQQACALNPQLVSQIFQADNPAAELYAVGLKVKEMQEFQNNPDAAREKMKADLLAEIRAELGQSDEPVTPSKPRRTVDLSTARSVKATSTAEPGDKFKELFPG